jgi:hypothetical protein
MSRGDAAVALRESVAALSSRMSGDYGELVPAATAERTAALLAHLERGAAGSVDGAAPAVTAADIETLDSWIRLADSAMLHDDAVESRKRGEIGERLRAVRELVVPDGARLTDDTRDA